VSEAILEGLLRTHGTRIFPGFLYFDFKPAIRSRHGTRHPDGALLAPATKEWWVVEVETHVHDVEGHVMPQLEALSDGIYSREAFQYLDRHAAFRAGDFRAADVWEPGFLLVVDHTTPFLRQAATINGFRLVEIGVFRNENAEYALRLSGSRPSVAAASSAPRGVDVEVQERHGVALLVPVGGRTFVDGGRRTLIIGDREVQAFTTSGKDTLAVPMDATELFALVGETNHYRITPNGTLIPLADSQEP
jgi:hypothetical protein